MKENLCLATRDYVEGRADLPLKRKDKNELELHRLRTSDDGVHASTCSKIEAPEA